MDPKRKKIYIVLIIVCFTLSAGILGWTFLRTSDVPPVHSGPANLPPQTADVASGDSSSGFHAPSVFPATDVFKTEVLNSAGFKALKPYEPVNVTGQLGRPDPFRNY